MCSVDTLHHGADVVIEKSSAQREGVDSEPAAGCSVETALFVVQD